MSTIRGSFKASINGVEVCRSDNIITTAGRLSLLRYLAGLTDFYAESIAIGVGSGAPTVDDKGLAIEVFRGNVDVTSIDFNDSEILFKATFPQGERYVIYELGLFPDSVGDRSFILFGFTGDDDWTGDYILELLENRFGDSGILVNADDTGTIITNTEQLGLASTSLDDKFRLGFILHDDNCEEIVITFTDVNGNEIEATYDPPAFTEDESQYCIIDVDKRDFTGLTNDWSNIIKTEIEVVAKTAAETEIILDILKVIDSNIITGSEVIAKTLAPTPIEKKEEDSLDIEYTLRVPV